jgi:hypothetical protein
MAKKKPLRKCTGCQELKDKREMLRIVKTSEGEFLIDISGKANGRGAYICKSKECLEKSLKNKGLERSFKCSIPKDISESLKEALDQLE